MAEVNKAYAILIDPEARRRFDETGQADSAQDIDEGAVSILEQVIDDIFENERVPDERNFIAHLQQILKDGHIQIRAQRQSLRQKLDKIDRRLKKLTAKSERSLVIEVTRRTHAKLNEKYVGTSRAAEAIERALELVQETTDSTIETPSSNSHKDSVLQQLMNNWNQR